MTTTTTTTQLRVQNFSSVIETIRIHLLPEDEIISDPQFQTMLWRVPCVAHSDVKCEQNKNQGLRLLATSGPKDLEYLIGVQSGAWELPSTIKKDDTAKDPKICPASQAQVLTALLWNDPQPVHRSARVLGVGDPLASMVTLVWEASEETIKETFLEHFLHRYFVQMRAFERTLAQRPGLQIVLVAAHDAGPKLKPDFLRATQQLMRKLGDASLDVQIRWIEEEKPEKQSDWLNDRLEKILSAHGPGFNNKISRRSPNPDTLKKGLNAFIGGLPEAKQVDAGGESIWPRFSGALGWSPDQLPAPPLGSADFGATADEHQAASLLLSAQFKVRRFIETPMWVDLAPVTLIASENAAGKTTLVEGLSQLYLGRARLRTRLPDHGHFFNSISTSVSLPMISVLRLTQATDQPLPWQAVLPLFADDAELDRGRLGELSLLTLLPVVNKADRDKLLELMEAVDSAVVNLQEAARQLRASEPENVAVETGGEDFVLNGEHLRLWTDFVADEAIEGDAEPSALDPLGRLRTAISQGASMPAEATGVTVTLSDLKFTLDLMFRWLLVRRSANNWRELDPLWHHPSTRNHMRTYAANRLEDVASQLERQIRTYCEVLARQVFSRIESLDKASDAVERYLDTSLEVLHTGIRANTARQVRQGFAARLTRWQAANPNEFPILVVDEPVLGQDASAAAAALGRFLRLRRIHEGLRWARSFQARATTAPNRLLGVTLDSWSSWPEPPPENRWSSRPEPPQEIMGNTGNADHSGWQFPLPPQVILASHLSATLVAAADSEGVVLDLEMQNHLRALVFPHWKPIIRDVLQNLTEDFDKDTRKHLVSNWKPLTAAALVRLWSMPTDAPPVRDIQAKELDGWWNGLCEALTKLRLGGLRHLAVIQVTAARKDWTSAAEDKAKAKAASAAEFEAASIAEAEREAKFIEILHNLARRLVLWLIATDLLPAILADAQAGFEVSGVALRQLPAAGGEALELGPSRLRRVGAWLEILPPVSASAPVPKGATTAGQADGTTAASVDTTNTDSADGATVASVDTINTGSAEPEAEPEAEPTPETETELAPEPEAELTPAPEAAPELTMALPQTPLKVVPEVLLPTSFAVGVWRVLLVSEGGVLPSALRAAIDEAFRAAGMLPYDGEPPHVRLRVPARPTVTQTGELTWRCSWVLVVQVGGQVEESLIYEHTRGCTKDSVDQWVQDNFTAILVRWLQTRSDLTRTLELLRLRRLASGPEGDSEFVAVGIWTYIPDEVADPEVAYTFGSLVQDGEAETTLQARWDARITQGLLLLRQTLGGSSRKQVRLYPKCHPAVAIRAGAIFSHRTGFSLEAMQNGSAWDMDLHKARVYPDLRIDSLPVQGTTPRIVEVHVLLSFSQDVQAGYEAWRARDMTPDESPRVILHIQPPGGPGRDSVPRGVVTDLGESIVETLIRRKKTGDRLRFFIAAPNALSLALGRSLNALGDVRLMDWIKEEMRYVETFKLMC